MQAQCAISFTKTSGGRLRKKWKPFARPSSRKVRMPLATSSEPASTFGQKTSACISELRDRLERLVAIWSKPWPYSVVTGCCMTSRNGCSGSTGAPVPPNCWSTSRRRPELRTRDEVDRGAADVEDPGRILAHRDHAPRGELGGGEVDVRELRHRVADALVDRAGDLARPACARPGCSCTRPRSAVAIVSKRSATVTTMSGWSSSKSVGSSSRPRPVDFAIVAGVSPSMMKRMVASGAKPSCVTHVERVAEPLQHERRAGDELELELGVLAHRLERGLDPGVVRAAGDDDADLAALRQRPPPASWWSASSVACRAAADELRQAQRGDPVAGSLRGQHLRLEHGALRDRDLRDDALLERRPRRVERRGRAPSGRRPSPPRPGGSPRRAAPAPPARATRGGPARTAASTA